MSANAKHPGKVINLSKQSLWVIWDEGESNDKKVWKAKVLAAGRQTPRRIDIDGVKAFNTGVKISDNPRSAGTDEWWWLGNGAHVNVSGGSNGTLSISVTNIDGVLSRVSNDEVDKWGVQKDSNQDVSWGEPAEAE